MSIISIYQKKGGDGKSTSTLNLGCALGELGYKICISDLDDQRNTTTSIFRHFQAENTLSDLILKDEVQLSDVVIKTNWKNVWLLPASENLSGTIKYLNNEVGGHLILKEKLADNGFDIILCDCPPSSNIIVVSVLCASDYLFIPFTSKYFSLNGLIQTLGIYNKVKSRLNPDLKLLGMAAVIHDKRNALSNEVLARVKKQYPNYLLKTVVGINIKIQEAQARGESILTYAPPDRGADQYRNLAQELFSRTQLKAEKEAVYGQTNP